MLTKTINEVDFIIFDTETTGLSPALGDRIVEIAAVRLRGEEKLSTFNSLVNPGRNVSEAAFAVNHISDDMLKGAPPSRKVIPGFMEFAKGGILASYNANFDLGFLDTELKILSMVLPEDLCAIDILTMARRLIPDLNRYSLWNVAKASGIESIQEHRAYDDVILTIKVFEKLKGILRLKKIDNMDALLRLFSVTPKVAKGMLSQRVAEIREAINLKLKIKIRYMARSNSDITEREVEPIEVKEEQGRFYLVGNCHLRKDKRTFNIDSILYLEIV